MNSSEQTQLRSLPSISRLLQSDEAIAWRQCLGPDRVTAIARRVTEELRRELQDEASSAEAALNGSKGSLLNKAIRKLDELCTLESQSRIRRVINATGVILHTNLGRAPLSEKARAAVMEASGYCTLEYDAIKGSRGRRGMSVEKLLIQLTGAEDALVVNNCAAAALLILKVLAAGGETIVSRGELVEIGGDFRVPDVMANSGTTMIEIGSTNRTRVEDYRGAIGEKTRLIMRVHPSNYRIVGFTTAPSLVELAECAHSANLLLYEDAGSGVLTDLGQYELGDEPVIRDCIADGADVVSFSGDKLLGSAQAGLIVGRSEIVQKLRRHSLYRALRADKLCLAALEATLESHLNGQSFAEIPALRMLTSSRDAIQQRAEKLLSQLSQKAPAGLPLRAEIVDGESAIGGGCGPNVQPPTTLITLEHENLSADSIEKRLRSHFIPIITRVANGKVLIDLRTVAISDEDEIISALRELG